jgi:DNA-binding NarL/FixJ family response regulator
MALEEHPTTTRPYPIPELLDGPRRANQTCIRVLSVDHHPLFREGTAAIINRQPDMALVSQAAEGREAIRQYREHRPDVTVMDVRLPDLEGIDVMTAIRAEFPTARVIMLSSLGGDVEVRRALEAGACGYLLKNMPPSELLRAIREVYAGRKRVPPEVAAPLAEHLGDDNLSGREIEVLGHLCNGSRNRDIGEHLRISEGTVKVHMSHILQKLGAKDRTEAIAIAARRGIVRL